MTIPTIVTTTQLRDHLRLAQPTGSPVQMLPDETDLQLKLDAATQLICEYIADQHPASPTWIATIENWGSGSPADPAPAVIVLAVLEQAAEFYRFRGDDEDAVPREPGMLLPAVENLVSRYKNRAFA